MKMTVNIKCIVFTSIEVREVANSSREKLWRKDSGGCSSTRTFKHLENSVRQLMMPI